MTEQTLLKKFMQMIEDTTIAKDISAIPCYYHPEFVMHSYGKTENFEEFISSHQKMFSGLTTYKFRYDEETFVENGDKIALRLWVNICQPSKAPQELEVLIIAKYKDGKIYRMWEMAYPEYNVTDFF